ncbi:MULTISPECIES: hypothetical protein [unclassified Nocardia]|uniref:hypothetical protein n=1 Tax=unclassified Nocardia TaxID=2637762 RepID=UPI00278C21EE|nr:MULTISPECIES: hypothetical protein [unclassified Nocardia]
MHPNLTFLGKGGSGDRDCPSLYATDPGFLVVGWRTGRAETVEIPHLLLGFLPHESFINTTLSDTGRGTFSLTGTPVTDPETLDYLNMESYETAIEVPKAEREYFGATAD